MLSRSTMTLCLGLLASVSATAVHAACTASGSVVTCVDDGINPDETFRVERAAPGTTTINLMSGFQITEAANGVGSVSVYSTSGGSGDIAINQNAGSTVTKTGDNGSGIFLLSTTPRNATITQSGTIDSSGSASGAANIIFFNEGVVTLHQTGTGVAHTRGNNSHTLNSALGNSAIGTANTVIQDAGGLIHNHSATTGYGVFMQNGRTMTADIAGRIITEAATVDGVHVQNRGAGTSHVFLRGTSSIAAAGDGVVMTNSNATLGSATLTFDQAQGSIVDSDGTGLYMENRTSGNMTAAINGTLTGGGNNASDYAVRVTNGVFGATPFATANINVGATGVVSSSAGRAIEGVWAHTTIDNSGQISGAINTLAPNSNTTDVLINRAGATYNGALTFGGGNDLVSLNSGSTTSGTLDLGADSDVLNIDNGSNTSGVTAMVGGDNVSALDGSIDNLNLNNGWSGALIGANTTNWENINVHGGALSFSDAQVTVSSDAGYGVNVNGGTLDAKNGLDVTGNVYLNNSRMLIGIPAGTNVASVSNILSNTAGSTLDFSDPAAGDQLNIGGDYIGGGSLLMETVLGDDSSVTDHMTVGGATFGASSIFLTNLGGAGARTLGDGIELVQVDGASVGTFSLANGPLLAGAFAYDLYQGGIADPGDGDWYLRSQLSPTTPVYESYPQALAALNGVSSLQQRVGNCYWAGAGNEIVEQGDGPGAGDDPVPAPVTTPSACSDQKVVWARIEGSHGHLEPKVSTTGAEHDLDHWKIQAGADFALHETSNGSMLTGGLTAHYGEADLDVMSSLGDGAAKTRGYGIGGTLTWYGIDGLYVDTQAQATWFDSDLGAVGLANLASGNNGFGYALSIETGKRVAISNSYSVTPQAQLAYSTVTFDTFTDPYSAVVSMRNGDSLKGRLGASLDRESTWIGANSTNSRTHVYGIANLYYEFLDGMSVDVSGTSLVSRNDPFWGGVGGGGSYNWNDDKYSIYGEASVNTSLTNFTRSYALNGTVGLKTRF